MLVDDGADGDGDVDVGAVAPAVAVARLETPHDDISSIDAFPSVLATTKPYRKVP